VNTIDASRTLRLALPALMLATPFSLPHESSVAPFINEIAEDFAVSTGTVGQFGTATSLGGMGAALALAPLIGQMSVKRVLAVVLAVLAVSSILSGLVTSFAALMVLRLIAGMASGVVLASALTAVGRLWTDPRSRTVRTGLVIGAMAGGPGLLGPALRIFGSQFDWHSVLILYGILAAASATFAALALPGLAGAPGTVRYGKLMAEAARGVVLPVVREALLLRLLLQALFGVVFGYLAAFFIHLYPGRTDLLPPMFFVGPLGFMLAAFAGGKVLGRIGVARGSAMMVALNAAGLFAFAWIEMSPFLTGALFFIYGATIGIAQTGITSLLYQHSGNRQGPVIFVNGALGPGGSMLGNAAGGAAILLTNGFLGWQILVTVAVSLTLVPAVLVGMRRYQ